MSNTDCDLELVTGRTLRVTSGDYDSLRKWLKESEGMTFPALHFETPDGPVTVRRAGVVSVAAVGEE